MKKLICALLAVILLSTVCPALAATYQADTPVAFTLTYPDGWMYVDNTDDENNTETTIALVFLGEEADDGFNLNIYTRYYDFYEGYTLQDADKASMQEYIDDIIKEYTDSPEYLNTIYSTKDAVPFVCFHMTDKYGPYIYAETMIDGWTVEINGFAYVDEKFDSCRALTDREVALFTLIVQSFSLDR